MDNKTFKLKIPENDEQISSILKPKLERQTNRPVDWSPWSPWSPIIFIANNTAVKQ